MIWIISATAAVLLVAGWCLFDFILGRKNHRSERSSVHYPRRFGQVTCYKEGGTFFRDYVEDIKQADQSVYILFYIFRHDSIGSQLVDLLCQKAEEGVTVRVMLDRVSSGMNRKGREKLKKSGVFFTYSRPVSPPYLFYSLQRRNHRKVTVIDGEIGYTGGFNVGDEYLGRDPKLGYWRDFHLRIKGEGVQDLVQQFTADWLRERPEDHFSPDSNPDHLPEGDTCFHFLATDGDGVLQAFLDMIRRARFRIDMATPYFIPGDVLLEVLLEALERGVVLTMILPAKRDHPLVQEASWSYLEPLIRAGAGVYHYNDGFFHAKALLIDDVCCDIGSANFDQRSFHLNLEMNTLIEDKTFIEYVRNILEKDLEHASRLRLEDVQKRPLPVQIKEKAARLVEPLL
ncbi:cardiolipin synthase [Salibacterium halotolerans]|uniref:Cardiolipin synthase n=1 Tax=Salibacterium halotolerans TaxID=1884432 RepID=A0A1I5V4K6_9BACI|nr:cardiolipin synthase [Salibacterium halotolerans]SFQ02453.1 cardiolipin synthase [Salibacterium halotolerans]